MKTELNHMDELSRAVVKIQTSVLAVVCAIIGGGGLFVMTLWLLIKDGENVGLHLNLLGHYFWGYSVTWGGSLLGLLWGALAGGVAGLIIGQIYNSIVRIRHRSAPPPY